MNDDPTTRLLRLTPPRAGVPGERTARVRDAVREEWKAGIRQRRSRLRRATAMAAALLATAAAIVLIVRGNAARHAAVPAPPALAVVERVDGRFRLTPGEAVHAGEWIDMPSGTRASLRVHNGTTVRLDAGSRARFVSPSVIELSSGGLYVDTGASSPGLEVRTPLGTAHDIGTRFEVRLDAAALRVRVRSGQVEVRGGGRSATASAGTLLTLTREGIAHREATAYGPEWEWTWQVAPAFSIEGRPLAEVLDHLSREQGWTVRYEDALLAKRASTIVLHGSIDGLSPQDALGVAIATSGLTHRFERGTVFVGRP